MKTTEIFPRLLGDFESKLRIRWETWQTSFAGHVESRWEISGKEASLARDLERRG
jgi:hypothetical protein